MPRPPIAFMHVPKTAGTALAAALGRWAGDTLYGLDQSIFGAFADFDGFAPDLRKMIYSAARPLPQTDALLMGHMAASTLARARRDTRLVTILREPRSRLLSHWLFWRGQTDEELQPWGAWADRVRLARAPLWHFLADPQIACQTDNIATRMLLWPHPAIPANGFIPPAAQPMLRRAAQLRLEEFAFADVVENPRLEGRLQAWLGGELRIRRANETRALPAALRQPLDQLLRRDDVLDLLEQRSRLDRALWLQLMRRGDPAADAGRMAEHSLLATVARHAALMAPDSS